MIRLLQSLPGRTLWLLVVSAVTLTLIGAYAYIYKASLTDLKVLQSSQQALRSQLLDNKQTQQTTEQLATEVEQLERRLLGDQNGQSSVQQYQNQLIGRLDDLAVRQGLRLTGMHPGSRRKILIFDELPLDVEIRGDYQRIFAWLQAVDREVQSLQVKSMDVQPSPAGDEVTVHMTLASYKVADEAT